MVGEVESGGCEALRAAGIACVPIGKRDKIQGSLYPYTLASRGS